jgi:hypothetical protein
MLRDYMGDRRSRFAHPKAMHFYRQAFVFDTPSFPSPALPPINEPPADPENPHLPVREPDPAEPSQI